MCFNEIAAGQTMWFFIPHTVTLPLHNDFMKGEGPLTPLPSPLMKVRGGT